MKTLIILVVGLLAVGCLTPEQKQKALRDSVVGEYEFKRGIFTIKQVLLENGVIKTYMRDEQTDEGKWRIVNGEIHNIDQDGKGIVFRINKDKSITLLEYMDNGERVGVGKDQQGTYKKIK